MSSDDGILIQENSDGNWWVFVWISDTDNLDSGMVFSTLELAVRHAAGIETEYGIRFQFKPKMLQVTFQWSLEHGTCYDCGLPAAYSIDSRNSLARYCSVCAACHAADGEDIFRLFKED